MTKDSNYLKKKTFYHVVVGVCTFAEKMWRNPTPRLGAGGLGPNERVRQKYPQFITGFPMKDARLKD